MLFNKNLITVYLFLGFLILYYFGSFSKVPFGDCMGFITDVEKQKFIFSTSVYAHFLFINSLILIKKIFPFFDSIEIGRWFSIFFGAISISILFRIIHLLTKNNWISILTSGIFGLSFSFWRNAEIVEIYTFNIFFIALFILFSVKFYLEKKEKYLLITSFILGISLWNHIQNILFIPGFIYLATLSNNKKLIVKSFIVFSILFLSLFIIPIINKESILIVFKSVSNHKISFNNLPKDIIRSIFFLSYNFWGFTILGFLGLFQLLKKHFSFALFSLITSLPVFGFSTLFNVSDNYVFFLPFNFIFAIYISFGLISLQNKKIFKIIALSSLLIPTFYIISFFIFSKTEKGSLLNSEKQYKGGLRYYMLPWLNNNVGILETTIDNNHTQESIDWMKNSAKEFIEIRLKKGDHLNEIKEK